MDIYPVILSFDVGVINLSYCLLTKKEFIKNDGTKYIDWFIIDWAIINLTNRDEQKCNCGLPAKLTNVNNNITNYYCKKHSKTIITTNKEFDDFYHKCDNNMNNYCKYEINKKTENILCSKKSNCYKLIDNKQVYYCNTHAKQLYKNESKLLKMKSFKFKNSSTLNFDDVKYNLMMELEKRTHLLSSDYVVIENQPSFKNPRMKSIASTLYDYYLIRGIIDKNITKSKITQVKFMSPSNKLKLATDGDTKQLIKAKKTDDTQAYKLTKSLGIKYCTELIQHLPESLKLINSFKKKDDLADSFLQGAYFYCNKHNY